MEGLGQRHRDVNRRIQGCIPVGFTAPLDALYIHERYYTSPKGDLSGYKLSHVGQPGTMWILVSYVYSKSVTRFAKLQQGFQQSERAAHTRSRISADPDAAAAAAGQLPTSEHAPRSRRIYCSRQDPPRPTKPESEPARRSAAGIWRLPGPRFRSESFTPRYY